MEDEKRLLLEILFVLRRNMEREYLKKALTRLLILEKLK